MHLVDARDDDFPVIPLGNKTDSLAPFRQARMGSPTQRSSCPTASEPRPLHFICLGTPCCVL